MTANRNFKKRVRARAAKTGESYTAALRHLRLTPPGADMTENLSAAVPTTEHEAQTPTNQVRLAVAQTSLTDDPQDPSAIHAAGAEVRRLMRQAAHAGARVVHFPEGVLGAPRDAPRVVRSFVGSDGTPGEIVAPAGERQRSTPVDWSQFAWAALRAELAGIAKLAGELRLWTVVGSVHRLTPPHRAYSSLYVISDRGRVVSRYDERMLTHTKLIYMYAPGTVPVTFDVDGVRFGCLIGIEMDFPDMYREYERLGVNCVLSSTSGAELHPDIVAKDTGMAAAYRTWVAVALPAAQQEASGVLGPDGGWAARVEAGAVGLAVTDVGDRRVEYDPVVRRGREWPTRTHVGVYEPFFVTDSRSDVRSAF